MNPSKLLNILDTVFFLFKNALQDISDPISYMWIPMIFFASSFYALNFLDDNFVPQLLVEFVSMQFFIVAFIWLFTAALSRNKLNNLLIQYCESNNLYLELSKAPVTQHLFFLFLIFVWLSNFTSQFNIFWVVIPLWNTFVMPIGKVSVLKNEKDSKKYHKRVREIRNIVIVTTIVLQLILWSIFKILDSLILKSILMHRFEAIEMTILASIIMAILPVSIIYCSALAAQLSFLIYLELPHKLLNISSANTK